MKNTAKRMLRHIGMPTFPVFIAWPLSIITPVRLTPLYRHYAPLLPEHMRPVLVQRIRKKRRRITWVNLYTKDVYESNIFDEDNGHESIMRYQLEYIKRYGYAKYREHYS